MAEAALAELLRIQTWRPQQVAVDGAQLGSPTVSLHRLLLKGGAQGRTCTHPVGVHPPPPVGMLVVLVVAFGIGSLIALRRVNFLKR